MEYLVRPALHEESREGWAWIRPVPSKSSSHIRILNLRNGRSITCEKRSIEDNFRTLYNSRETTLPLPSEGPVIVLSGHYRDRLAVGLGGSSDLVVSAASGPIAGLRAGLSHPQAVVRTAVWLGLLSVGLGVLSVLLAIFIR